MDIEVIGGGSLGLLLAARLAPLCRLQLSVRTEEQRRLLEDEGIGCFANGREPSFQQVDCSVFGERAESWEADTFLPDWMLLTVKQKDLTPEFADKLARGMGASTRLLCFQNGLGHAEVLAKVIPREKIWLAITTEGARRESPVAVHHTGFGHTMIGKAFRNALPDDSAAADKLAALLAEAGWSHEIREDIYPAVWDKLVMNAVINPLTAVLRIPNGMLLEQAGRLGLMKDLYREAVLAAEASGVRIADDLWERIVKLCRATSANHSSMLQDVEKGRETEIAWISGAILEKARENSLKLPLTGAIYRIMKAIDKEEQPDGCVDASLM